jgi:hypothetical protein
MDLDSFRKRTNEFIVTLDGCITLNMRLVSIVITTTKQNVKPRKHSLFVFAP